MSYNSVTRSFCVEQRYILFWPSALNKQFVTKEKEKKQVIGHPDTF